MIFRVAKTPNRGATINTSHERKAESLMTEYLLSFLGKVSIQTNNQKSSLIHCLPLEPEMNEVFCLVLTSCLGFLKIFIIAFVFQ